MNTTKFNIQHNAEECVTYILQITNASPKKLRCDTIPMLRNYAWKMLENIIRANRLQRGSEDRFSLQQDALTLLELLNSCCDICSTFGYITKHQLEVVVNYTYSLFNSIEKWIESDKKYKSE